MKNNKNKRSCMSRTERDPRTLTHPKVAEPPTPSNNSNPSTRTILNQIRRAEENQLFSMTVIVARGPPRKSKSNTRCLTF